MAELLFTVTQEGQPRAVVLTSTGESALTIADIFIGLEGDELTDCVLAVRPATEDEQAKFIEFSKCWRGEVSLAAMAWEH